MLPVPARDAEKRWRSGVTDERAATGRASIVVRKLAMLVGVIAVMPDAALAATMPQVANDISLGMASCASSLCHGAVDTWKQSNVSQNEYMIWSRRDKHARAYAVLSNERSKEIAKKLQLPEPANRSSLCLDCHSHNVPESRQGKYFALSDGVTCEACHGPSGRWIESHVARGNRHEQNIARGMYPIADPIARARLCLSCHFGNAQKFVTHRMMAAGHPRMSFELDTFTQLQPPHYRLDAEHDWDGVRIWAVGQALAAQQLLDMLLDARHGRDSLFPELVLFDCHACHHRMKDGRNAGARLGLGPGLVRLNDSSFLMLRQVVRRVSADGETKLAQQVGQLHRAVAEGSDALDRAREVQQTVSDLLPAIGAYKFSRRDLQGILTGLIDDGLAGEYSDYQGAEQAAMAIQSVVDFLRKQGSLRTPAVVQAMQRLLATVTYDEGYSAATFQQALRELKSVVSVAN